MDEFLTAGQIQSFFSRTVARRRHAVAPEDDDEETDDNSRAAEEEEAFSDAAMRTSAPHSLRHVERVCDELVQQTQ